MHTEQTGAARCAAGDAARPPCCCSSSTFNIAVFPDSATTSGTKDLTNLSGHSRVRRAFANKGRKLPHTVPRGFEMKAETDVFY